MKRKISLNLAPIKRSMSKPQLNPKEIAPSPPTQSPTYRTHGSEDGVCDSSPYIQRRALTLQTERELRVACRLVLQNLKPSDHGMKDIDPKLDFGAMSRRTERRPTAAEIRIRKPTGAPEDVQDSYTKGRPSTGWELAAKTQPAALERANTGRRRADSGKSKANFAWLDDRDDKRTTKAKQANELKLHTDMDVDPLTTNSTDIAFNYASTAPTSAVPTSGGNSNWKSCHLDNPAAIADTQATEWMHHELEKSRERQGSQSLVSPLTDNASRPPSRAQSIRNNIKDYIFPSTSQRGLSRAPSQKSIHMTNTHTDQVSPHEKCPGSSNGWRSWSLPRRSSSRNSKRPSISMVNTDEELPGGRPDINLNRELPPLPGLDTWREPAQPQLEEANVPISPTHIASLIRSQDQHQESTSTVYQQHRRNRSDMSSTHYEGTYPQNPVDVRPDTAHSVNAHQTSRYLNRTTSGTSAGHLNLMMGEWALPTTARFKNRQNSNTSGHARQPSTDSTLASPNSSMSHQSPNHMRNTSSDAPQQKPVPKEEQKSRLRRVFSGWMLKKERKEDWVHKVEKQGVREGNLMRKGSVVAPEVRY